MKKAKYTIIGFIITSLYSNICFAINKYYNDHQRGWYYFEDLKKKKLKKQDEAQNIPLAHMPDDLVLKKLEAKKQELEVQKARLVLEPTIENAKNYQELQMQEFKQAEKVSNVWQTVLLMYPHLDSRITNPIDDQAIKIKYTQDIRNENNKITEFAKHFELIYFFMGKCAYCNAFTPVLKDIASNYNFVIRAISLDNTTSEFKTEHNLALVEKLQVKNTPTLIAYNKANDIYIPIARSYLSIENLKKHIILAYDNINILANRGEY